MRRETDFLKEEALTAEMSDTARSRRIRWRPPDVARLFAALEQNLLWVVLAPFLFVLATMVYILFTSPSYEIGAQLTLQYGRELRAPATVRLGEGQQVAPVMLRNEDSMGEVQLLRDPRLVREVVYDLGEEFFFPEYTPETLFQEIKHFAQETLRTVREEVRSLLVQAGMLPSLTPLERVILALEQAISIELVTRSEVIKITLQFPDREGGEMLLNRYLDEFFEARANMLAQRSAGPLLEAEIDHTRTELFEAETELSQARQESGAWSTVEQRRLLIERLEALDERGQTIRLELAATDAQLALVNAELTGLDTMVEGTSSTRPNPLRDRLSVDLVDLRLQLLERQRRFGPRSPEVNETEEQIAEVEARLAAAPEQVSGDASQRPNPLHDVLLQRAAEKRTEQARLRGELQALKTEKEDLSARVRRLDTAAIEIGRLEREVERLMQRVGRYTEALNEDRIDALTADARLLSVAIMSPPTSGLSPVSPRFLRLILIAAALGVVAIAGFVLLLDGLRPKVRSDEDIETFLPDVIVRPVPNRR